MQPRVERGSPMANRVQPAGQSAHKNIQPRRGAGALMTQSRRALVENVSLVEFNFVRSQQRN